MATAARTDASSRTSSRTARIAEGAWAAVSSAPARLRSPTTTLAPLSANNVAHARPIPLPPPVTNATPPLKSIGCSRRPDVGGLDERRLDQALSSIADDMEVVQIRLDQPAVIVVEQPRKVHR